MVSSVQSPSEYRRSNDENIREDWTECRNGMVEEINKYVKAGVVRGKDHVIIIDYRVVADDDFS